MPDRDDRLLELDDPYEDDWEPVDDADEGSLPPRPRRRIVTPLSVTLIAVLIAALGFSGGVLVQKHQDATGDGSDAAAAAFAAARGGGTGAGAGGGAGGGAGARGGFSGRGAGGGQGTPTVGSVTNKNGSTLYVKDSDGNTVRVKTTSHSKINRTASTTAGAIHPGDTVVVQGTKSSSGTLTATQINATASNATSGFAGLFGGGGGRGGFLGGGASGGAGSGSGRERERRRRSGGEPADSGRRRLIQLERTAGAHPIAARSSPGRSRVAAGSQPGRSRVAAGSQPGRSRVAAGSQPGGSPGAAHPPRRVRSTSGCGASGPACSWLERRSDDRPAWSSAVCEGGGE